MSTLCTPFSTPAPTTERSLRAILWKLVSSTIFKLLPSPAYKPRRAILVAFGATLDPTTRVRGGVKISHPWNLVVGWKTAIGEGTTIYNPATLTIGKRSVVSQYCLINCVTSDYNDPSNPQHPSPLTIGDDVWVATECLALGNQSIPNGVVIGARSLITNANFTPWTIATGNPAVSRKERHYTGLKS